METQPRVTQQVVNRPQVQYRRPFQPQILQRPNTYQQIQPPLMIDDQDSKETIPINTNDINYFEDPSSQNAIVLIS